MMTSRKEFTEGAIARLKTGGPTMVVENVRSDNVVPCVWFSGEQIRRDAFHYLALELIEPLPNPIDEPGIEILKRVQTGTTQ